MKAKLVTLLLVIALMSLAPLVCSAKDAEAIEEVIEAGYIGGIWMDGDEAAARRGFDASFVMQVPQEDGVRSVTLDAWLDRLGLHGQPLKENITHEIEVLDQTGCAAVAKVKIFQDLEALYTDYISLYHFADGWRIVAKTFYAHD